MMQCERCGASNQPQSRFCVSCGSPLVAAEPAPPQPQHPQPQHPPQQPQPAPAAPQYQQQPAPAYPQQRGPAPAWNPAAQPAPHVPQANPQQYMQPVPSMPGPPSSGLPFAATASPPSREEFDQVKQARDAALAGNYGGAHGSGGYQAQQPGGAYPGATNPPPQGQYPQATAAMPGVSQDPSQVPDGAPRILCGFIVSYENDPLGAFWPIYQGKNVLGREGAPIELDIRIAHPTTSSRHAILSASALPGRLVIEDTGSTNGTFVNDARLSPGQPVEVNDGDRVRFGLFPTVVKLI